MSVDSPNKTVIGSLIATLQQKVEPNKLYDALSKIFADVNKIYDALFGGPLPAVDGSLLNLRNISKDNLPADIAYTDVSNEFTEAQTIAKIRPTWEVVWKDVLAGIMGTVKGRMEMTADGSTIFSNNMYWDGTTWLSDSGNGAGFYIDSNGNIYFKQQITGINYNSMLLDVTRALIMSPGIFTTGSLDGEIIIKNNRNIKSNNFADTALLPLIGLDINNLVSLGSNPVGATTGVGNVSIPRSLTADLPLAGATRNGIILIDKSAAPPRLCFYVNGLRYYVAGTAF